MQHNSDNDNSDNSDNSFAISASATSNNHKTTSTSSTSSTSSTATLTSSNNSSLYTSSGISASQETKVCTPSRLPPSRTTPSLQLRCWPFGVYATLARLVQATARQQKETAVSVELSEEAARAWRPALNAMGTGVVAEVGPNGGEAASKTASFLLRASTSELLSHARALQQLNMKISSALLPLCDLDLANLPWSFAALATQCKAVMFAEVREAFVDMVLTRTSNQNINMAPTIRIDRIRASELLARPVAQANAEQPEMDLFSLVAPTVLGQAFHQLRGVEPAKMRPAPPKGAAPHVALNITFAGEKVLGQAGPYRAFFHDLGRELQENTGQADCYPLDLFVPTPNHVHQTGEGRDKCMPRPSACTPAHLELYRFVGRMFGIAVRTRVFIALNMPSFFWKMLCGQPVTTADLAGLDQSLVENVLTPLQACCTEDEFKEIFVFEDEGEEVSSLTYPILRSDNTPFPHLSTSLTSPSTEALPGRRQSLANVRVPVSWGDVTDYARLLEASRSEEIALQVRALRAGMADIIPVQLLDVLTWQELEERVVGMRTIDLELLKRHTEYSGGHTANSQHIRWFWQVLEGFSHARRARFVQFAYAQDRLPSTDQGFENYPRLRMLIKPSRVTDPNQADQALPHADTCFFNVELPVYSSFEIMKERLTTIVGLDWGMSGDDEASLLGMPDAHVVQIPLGITSDLFA